MTITRLDMQSLGPFADPLSLDFSPVAASGLFLINGPTGSGKTSILDAICFALYGASSGDERKAADLRSHHAPDDRPTQVQLDFTLGGQAYRVRRSLSARRVQTCLEKASLERIEASGETILLADRRAEVGQRIHELIHLDASQFRQVMVLPQGRFRDFLVASSQVREGILQSLFDTGRLERFTELLGRRRQAALDELGLLESRHDLRLGELGLTTAEGLGDRLAGLDSACQAAMERHGQAHEACLLARRQFEEARTAAALFQEYRQAEDSCTRLEASEESWAEMERRLEQARRSAAIQHLHANLQGRRQNLDKQEHELAELRAALVRSSARLADLESSAAKAEADHGQLPARQEQLGQRKALMSGLQELDTLDQEWQGALREADTLSRELAQSSHRLAETDAHLSEIRLARSVEQSWARHAASLESLAGLFDQLIGLERQKSQAEDQLRQVSDRTGQLAHETARLRELDAEAGEHLSAARQAAIRTEAGHLAHLLRPGEPCPVCGSTDHPSPAVPPDSGKNDTEAREQEASAIKARLQETELQLGLYRDRREQAAALVGKLAAEGEAKQLELRRTSQELGSLDADSRLPAEIASWLASGWNWQDLAGLRRKNLELVQRSHLAGRTLGQLDLQLSAQESNRDTQLTGVLTTQARQESLTATIANLEQRQLNARKRLKQAFALEDGPLPSAEHLRLLIDSDQAWIDRTRESHESAQAGLMAQQRDQLVLASRLAEQEKGRESGLAALAEADRQWREALRDNRFDHEAAALAAFLPEPRLRERQTALDAYRRELEVARARLEDAGKRIAGRQETDAAESQRRLAEAETEERNLGQELAASRHRLGRAREIGDELEKLGHELEESRRELQSLTALCRLVAGQDASGNYVNLQRYALSVYLDEVLVVANHHLHEMTRGRYELVREDFTLGKKRTGGLELYVQDTLTGLQRATESLSGGESFLSALSLALGLSSVVHERSGGVRLDTLFVDEGFGSLDEDSLQDAMQVLGRIHEKGRTIGIISHVRELRERIPTRLLVRKGPNGSTVDWDR